MSRSKPPRKRAVKAKPRRLKDAPDYNLPTREEILQFIRENSSKVGKRDIAREFGIKGNARVHLKKLLNEMAEEGLLAGTRREFRAPGTLPPVTVLEITSRDQDGDLIALPVVWDKADGTPPSVLVLSHTRPKGSAEAKAGIGERILARIKAVEAPDGHSYPYEAEPLKVLPKAKRRMLGIFRTRKSGGGSIDPINRKDLKTWQVKPGEEQDANDGDLVRFDIATRQNHGTSVARIVENHGNPNDQRKISLIAIHSHGLPDDFPENVLAESEELKPFSPEDRVDLRKTPLLTIDPPDARDHDDAVYAEPDSDPKNPGGYIVIVAIADVAHYVRPGTRLDREATLRGNSVYFPDRVVPMLPERISNDLCSLREAEDRPCLAVRLVFDANGQKRSHTFMRAIMKSAAKLSYQQAQQAIDGNPDKKSAPLLETVLKPLWAAYSAISRARNERQPLDLDLPERKILLTEDGRVDRITIPDRLDAHRLIEEMMIQANVAAAETLQDKKAPVVYRIHDAPSKEKLKSLREFLETLDLKIPPAGKLKPEALNRILHQAKELPVPELINEVILRSQAQAEYNTANIGHFGLNLFHYAHFTSPIRRYADLLVHRALIRALNLGPDGLPEEIEPHLSDISKQISEAERRAMAAERETIDRLIAAHLSDKVGATFKARIAGTTRSGLFVKLKETGADGFIPVSSLETDYFHYVEEAHALVGTRTGETFQLGDEVDVRLIEVIPSAGAMRFEMLSAGKKQKIKAIRGTQRSRRRRSWR